MKFVRLGNWSIRADRIVAVNLWQDKKCVTVYCGTEENYPMHFKTLQSACEAHEALLKELEKIEIGT
jgi:hypothetical protein